VKKMRKRSIGGREGKPYENPELYKRYRGKWVALVGERVLASGRDLRDVEEMVSQRHSDLDPSYYFFHSLMGR
jgi:hypothetical protein